MALNSKITPRKLGVGHFVPQILKLAATLDISSELFPFDLF